MAMRPLTAPKRKNPQRERGGANRWRCPRGGFGFFGIGTFVKSQPLFLGSILRLANRARRGQFARDFGQPIAKARTA